MNTKDPDWNSRTEAFDEHGWVIDLPPRLNELWDWFCAVWAYDFNDPRPLATLIRASNGMIPPEFSQAVSDIVAGERKPNRKAAVKLQIPARELGKLSGGLLVINTLRDLIRYRATFENHKPGAVAVAAYKGMKPIEVTRAVELKAATAKDHATTYFGCREETIDRLLREAKRRISRWPEV